MHALAQAQTQEEGKSNVVKGEQSQQQLCYSDVEQQQPEQQLQQQLSFSYEGQAQQAQQQQEKQQLLKQQEEQQQEEQKQQEVVKDCSCHVLEGIEWEDDVSECNEEGNDENTSGEKVEACGEEVAAVKRILKARGWKGVTEPLVKVGGYSRNNSPWAVILTLAALPWAVVLS